MNPTSQTAEELKKTVAQTMSLLRTLRDEIRVELHLAGMEAKERFKTLESSLDKAERVADEASQATRQLLEETAEALKSFKASLKAKDKL